VAFALEFQLRRYDGMRIWVRENVRAVRDASGNVICYEGSLEDITERKRAQEALRKERDFSTSLLEASPTFFVAISAQGRTLMMNQAMLIALGYTREEAIGRDYLDTFVPVDDRKKLAQVFEKLVHDRKPTLNENRVRAKDGRETLVEWHGRPIFTENGQFNYFFGVGIDITERRRAEEERARVEAQLRLAHKMQAIGQLAAGVAHDFNSILAVILGNAEHAQGSLKKRRVESSVLEALDQIAESVERGRALVQRLMTFGRARTGEPQRLDLNRIVVDMQNMLKPLIGKRIELRVVTAPDVKPVRANPGHIEEAIMNLVLNAQDAIPEGGVITVETANAVVDRAQAAARVSAKPGPYAVLSVSDTGIGMTDETKQRLFEPFFTTKSAEKGTGLGLSIVDGIVTQAGGYIELDTQLGKGATFKLYFPAAQ
jgi:PAS domain S-box-containing protein